MCQTYQEPKKAVEEVRYRLSAIYQRFFPDYVKSDERELRLSDKHFKAVDSAIACRTKKLGICVLVCTGCGEVEQIHRSCKHRFCGRCGNWATKQWAESTLHRLMNIAHHHIIMTLPKPFRKLSQMNGDLIHNLLFRAAAKVLQNWFAQKHQLKIGIVSVLHTAGSDLKYHPHVHMIVSRGGKNTFNEGFRQLKGNYLCPQRELGADLKELFCQELLLLYKEGKMKVYKAIQNSTAFQQWMSTIGGKHWIVSIQKPLEDVQQIVKYVGRYTKRACLSELKITKVDDKEIHFKFNDYKNSKRDQKPKVDICQMSANQFLDQLLQHVPNKGYKMVRYYGMYNSVHLQNIPKKWKLNAEKPQPIEEKEGEVLQKLAWIEEHCPFAQWRKTILLTSGIDPFYCNYCEQDRVLYMVEYEAKTIVLYEENTS